LRASAAWRFETAKRFTRWPRVPHPGVQSSSVSGERSGAEMEEDGELVSEDVAVDTRRREWCSPEVMRTRERKWTRLRRSEAEKSSVAVASSVSGCVLAAVSALLLRDWSCEPGLSTWMDISSPEELESRSSAASASYTINSLERSFLSGLGIFRSSRSTVWIT